MPITAPFIAWTGDADTQGGTGQDGRHYLLERQGPDILLWIDGDPMADLFPSMEAGREAADTLAFVALGRPSPIAPINARLEGFSL